MGKKKDEIAPEIVKEILEKKPKEPEMTDEEKVLTEREIRKYVKKTGGYRKGLPYKDEAHCGDLLKKMGRKKVEWDRNIIVPGIDKPTVKDIVW